MFPSVDQICPLNGRVFISVQICIIVVRKLKS